MRRTGVFSILLLFAGFLSCLKADVVTDWNAAALNAIRSANTPPPAASRNLAILHVSIYDAVNGIRRTHQPYLVTGSGPAGASVEAAAAAAAYKVLVTLYPALQPGFDTLYGQSLSSVPDGPAEQQGVEWGESVAAAILQARSTDGSANTVPYTPGTNPGEWRPTISFGGIVRPALAPQWGSVKPFGLISGSQFRPPNPPKLHTLQYALEVNQIKAIGSANSTVRTPEQTQIAQFWGYGPGTATPPGHWNQIAIAVIAQENTSLEQNARLLALLNIGLADTAIVSWDCKYVFNYWRPITAIQEAASDGNPWTTPDPSWTPLLPTPPFPEYTSGHSTFSGVGAYILAHFFGSRHRKGRSSPLEQLIDLNRGDRTSFTVGSDDLPGVVRSYKRFSEAAAESGMSRLYGGIHFMSANLNGLLTGAAAGNYICSNLLLPNGR